MYSFKARSGFMLMDALMGAALFAVFLTAVGTTILVGQKSFLQSGDLTRAVFLSEQALAGVRSIRDADWDSLVAGGPYGVAIGTSGTWEFSGTGTTTTDGYTTYVTLVASGTDAYEVTVNTEWSNSADRTGDVQYTTLVTNWRGVQEIGDWSSIAVQGSYEVSGTPLLQKVLVQGDYAFVTSDKSSGGAGLYVFDISNLSSPQRVASSFSLSGNGHNMVITGTGLYIAVEDDAAEIQMYNIADPDSLSAADQIATVNVPGSSRVRSLAYYGGYLYAGATESATLNEVYSYSVTEAGDITAADEFDTEGSLYDLSLKDGYTYMASSEDVAELRVVDVYDPEEIQNAPGNGFNLTDVHDGNAVAGFGTGMFLGRVEGGIIQELILFDVSAGAVPPSPPGPFYFEVSGTINDLEVEPGGRYAFIASDFEDKELQIIEPDVLVAGAPAEATYYDSTNFGQGVHYELALDALFFTTNTTLYILQPN